MFEQSFCTSNQYWLFWFLSLVGRWSLLRFCTLSEQLCSYCVAVLRNGVVFSSQTHLRGHVTDGYAQFLPSLRSFCGDWMIMVWNSNPPLQWQTHDILQIIADFWNKIKIVEISVWLLNLGILSLGFFWYFFLHNQSKVSAFCRSIRKMSVR